MRRDGNDSMQRGLTGLLVLLLMCAPLKARAAEIWENRLFPKGSPPAATIDVVDLRTADPDTKLAAITLQGQINKGHTARVYLRLMEGQAFWLEELKRKGYIRNINTISLDAYFDTYRACAKTALVYDPALPASLNVATMIASVESGFVVAPGNLERHRSGRRVVDLRARWKTNTQAYEWAFETLWPRMNQKLLAVYHPTHTGHHLRDYLVRNRVFTFWITGAKDADGVVSDHGKEKAFAEHLLAATGPNIPIIGWWGAGAIDHGMSEYIGVGWAGEYGKLTIPCDWQANLSLYSGIPVDMPALMARFKKRPRTTAPPLDPDKVYLSFAVMESGDAPSYWPHVQKNVWDDPKRGTVPIGWSFGPTILELMPSVAEWFLDQATPNDHFFLGLSGAGYAHPFRAFMRKTQDPEDAWRNYLGLTQHYMDLLGIRDVALYTDAWKPFDRTKQDPVTLRFTEGLPKLRSLILGMGRDESITDTTPHYLLGERDVLVSHVFTRWDAKNIGRNERNNTWLVEEIRANTPETRPAFMHVHPLSWSYYPTDLAAVLEALGDDYVAVSPGALHDLVKGTLHTKTTAP
jgi:putative glycoside hydrolase with GxGYxYP motif/GxGYxY motif-containing protein